MVSRTGAPHTPAPGIRELNAHARIEREVSSLDPPTHRRCSNCSAWLPLEAFPVNRRRHLGRSSWCRECARAATRDWRNRNPGYQVAYNAERRAAYRAENPLTERACVVCGRPFVKRPNALVCGPRCRERRKETAGVGNDDGPSVA